MDIPQGLTDAAMWALIVGFAQPYALQFIIQSGWDKKVQALVALGFSVLTGGVTAWFAGAFTGLGVVSTILVVAVASISFYKGFWKDVTPELKEKTSVESQRYNSNGILK